MRDPEDDQEPIPASDRLCSGEPEVDRMIRIGAQACVDSEALVVRTRDKIRRSQALMKAKRKQLANPSN